MLENAQCPIAGDATDHDRGTELEFLVTEQPVMGGKNNDENALSSSPSDTAFFSPACSTVTLFCSTFPSVRTSLIPSNHQQKSVLVLFWC